MSHAIVTALNSEWQHLRHDDVSSWACVLPEIQSARTAQDLLTAVSQRPNEVIPVLIRQCQDGTELAGRVVLQALLSKMILMASSGQARGNPDSIGDMVATMWLLIRTFPLESSTSTTWAGRLTLDCLKRTHAHWAQDTSPAIPTTVAMQLAAPDVAEPEVVPARDVITLASAQGWLDATEEAVMTRLFCDELTVQETTQNLALSRATMFRKRRAALDSLRDHADDLGLDQLIESA